MVNITVRGGNVFTVFYLPGPSLLMETLETLREDCLKLSAGCSPKYAYIYVCLSVRCPGRTSHTRPGAPVSLTSRDLVHPRSAGGSPCSARRAASANVLALADPGRLLVTVPLLEESLLL